MTIAQLLTSFIFIFLAAAPGRTSFVLIMLASRGHLKNIFIGAAAAFFVQCLISILLGQLLALFPQYIIELLAGSLFIYFAYSFWKHSKDSIKVNNKHISIKSVFLIVFMAEFGDVSQLAIAATSAKSPFKFSIFILAVFTMWLITGITIFIGHNLKKISHPDHIQKIASFAFLIVGIYLIVKNIY